MSKLTLLYAEDDEETRENYAFVLKRYFHKIYTAGDGREALSIYDQKRPDILLLDINMPYVDGLDVAKIVRGKDEKTPIIILTAHAERNLPSHIDTLKIEEYLLKPVDDNFLIDTMLNLINKIQNKDFA